MTSDIKLEVSCILCGGSDLSLVVKDFHGIRYGTEGSVQEKRTDRMYDIYDCNTCKTRFVSPYGTVSYEKLYTDTDIYKGLDDFAIEIRDGYDPVWKLISRGRVYFAVFDFLRGKTGVNGIDVGCGYGYLTHLLNRIGHHFVGLEVSESVVNRANEIYGSGYYCSLLDNVDRASEPIDLVVALEVIEHIDNPLNLIRQAKRLIRDGGNILITTPDIDFYRQQKSGDNVSILSPGWAGELPPIHFSMFSRDSMRWIAKELDMDIEFVVFPGGQTESMGIIFTKHGNTR